MEVGHQVDASSSCRDDLQIGSLHRPVRVGPRHLRTTRPHRQVGFYPARSSDQTRLLNGAQEIRRGFAEQPLAGQGDGPRVFARDLRNGVGLAHGIQSNREGAKSSRIPAAAMLARIRPDQRFPVDFQLAIFGLGEVGRSLAAAASARGWRVAGFDRTQAMGDGALVDAGDADAVERLSKSGESPRFDALVVTFPPQEVTPPFWRWLEELSDRRILLGSTSIYQRQGRGRSRITEETALEPAHDRLLVEANFLERGGMVVRLSGIYSEIRNPVRWLRQGRVGYEDRQVNLVHRDDIADAVLELAAALQPQPLYNLSDGQEHTWVQIVDRLVEEGLLEHPRRPCPLGRADGFVENQRFSRDFPGFRFRDFWEELLRLAERVGRPDGS